MPVDGFGEDDRRAQLFQLLKERALAAIATSPATANQLRSWSNRARSSLGTTTLWWAVRLKENWELSHLQRAMKTLTNRHASLRTSFALGAETLEQSVHGDVAPDVQEIEVPDEAAAAAALARIYAEPFDLGDRSLIRVRLIRSADGGAILAIAADHIVCDLWSLLTIIDELGTLLAAERRGASTDLPPVGQYHQFAKWQADFLDSAEARALWGLWDDRFRDGAAATELVPSRPRAAAGAADTRLHAHELSAGRCDRLGALARSLDTSVSALMLSLVCTLIHRFTGQEEVRLGTVLTGRSRAEFRSAIGDFVNAVPIAQMVSGEMTFRDVALRTKSEFIEAIRRQDIPLPLIAGRYAASGQGTSPLFRLLFLYQKPHLATDLIALPGASDMARDVPWGGGAVEPLALSQHGQEDDLNDLTFEFLELGDRTFLGLRYNGELFGEPFMHSLVSGLDMLIDAVTEDPDRALGTIDIMPEADRKRILAFNDTARAFDERATVIGLFEQRVRDAPDAVALREGECSLSYAELDARADRVASVLRAKGVGRDSIVAIYMERSFHMVEAILATWKAGGAYLPIDPENPLAHSQSIVADASPLLILTQAKWADRLAELAPEQPWIALDAELPSAPDAGERQAPDADALAYVIYTSGSTGAPKGVMSTHGGLTNRILWMQAEYGLLPSDVVLQKTPYTFDVSVWEFAWTLSAGATLVIARPGGHRDAAYLRDLIEGEAVTTVHFVPSMLSAFLEELGPGRCPSLSRVICSGEALSVASQDRFLSTHGAELHNLYGPTEASIDVTAWRCAPSEPGELSVPIGRPIANMRIYVAGSSGMLCPIGVPGELCIAGIGLARGYLNRPELTAERFIPCPWESEARMYRTGDLACWRADGALDYLGRVDDQVKLRGFRVELGEIEAVLMSHPAIELAAVALASAPGGDQRLYAYYKSRSSVDEAELQGFAAARLPAYMVPLHWHALDHVPTTSSGKLDRRNLPRPVFSVAHVEYEAPVTRVEHVLAGIWAELLGVAQVGRRDEFFALGGDSLTAIRMVAQVRSQLGCDVPLRELFERPALSDVASSLDVDPDRFADDIPDADRVTLLI